MGFGFFRTIWITLRAANYTKQAFDQSEQGLDKLKRKQMDFAMNSVRMGIMYLAFGAIMMNVMTKIMQSSDIGKKTLEKFGESVNKSLGKMGESISKILTPLLNIVAKFMELITAIPIVRDLIAAITVLGAILLLGAGIVKVFGGALTMLSIYFLGTGTSATVAQTSLARWIPASQMATASTWSLASALTAVTAGFTMGFSIVTLLSSVFGKLPAIIIGVTTAIIALAVALWSAAGGLSVLTFGAAAVAGGAALASAIAASQPTTYDIGTRFAPRTMLAVVRAGEGIVNPQNRLPTQSPIAEGRERGRTTIQNVRIEIGTVNTKADVDDLKPQIKRILLEAMREKT